MAPKGPQTMNIQFSIAAIALTNEGKAFLATLTSDQREAWEALQSMQDELAAMANDPEPDHVADRWVEEDAISERHDGYLSFLRNERS